MKINKKGKIILIATISIVIIMIVIITTSIKHLNSRSNNLNYSNNISQNMTKDTIRAINEDEELIRKLKSVPESERIRIYLGKYFKYIENKDYEKLYRLLYSEFKQNYFPSVEDYKRYIEQEFPDMIAIEYDSITRQGEYYIVSVTISNLVSGTDFSPKEKKFIIQENNYNDYFISFKK